MMWCCFAGSKSWETDVEDDRNGDHLWLGPEDDWITDEGKGSGWVRSGDCKQWVCVCVCVASEDDWITDEGKGSGWVRKGDCKQCVCVLLQISQKPITLRDHYRVFYSSCAYTDMCMHMRTHPYMHIHAHIHTHLYTYTHTHFASTWCDSETWWQLTRPRARSPNDFFVLLCAAET